jgi:hypothetical protein
MARPQRKSILSGMATLSLSLFGPAYSADVDGYVGTWVLDTGKSHFDPGPPIISETMIVTYAGNGGLRVLDAENFGDGTSDHLEWSTMLNGAKNSVSGGSDVDTVTERLTKLFTYEAIFSSTVLKTCLFSILSQSLQLLQEVCGGQEPGIAI